ncbi:little elongation complex subunit 1 [Talpa occidentalis]|uniref:little elongation complex subunit 1 n=1 Tax=Talpa occidentalis TaxID=50954 RepID=UPI001890957D|nr:little elongation complex subunit 1 [Talpa occidentalis]
MMPGETRSAAPGTAAELARCQGCASMRQNLNEHVEALVTLKQKIINIDNLFTEYQKKCDELQFARRENSTLHHQVEQMLQKISSLQQCQEDLGSLRAELEEKKSSLKLYQDTHQEYARVKEQCLRSDAQKKKLEAKVKKLEETAVKQTQDFKQLRNEKKILEKEFKKTQERLDEFSKQKDEKELRHIGTQISSDAQGSIDKRKVKLLLKELWLCINTTHRLPGEGSRCVPEIPAKESLGPPESGEDHVPTPAEGCPHGSADVQTCLAELSMEIEGHFSACRDAETERPPGAACPPHPLSPTDAGPQVAVQRAEHDRANLSRPGRPVDDDLQAAVDFFRLPPPLLSPVPSPPLVSPPLLPSSLAPETYFGEYTDSSDNESVQHRTSANSVSEDDTAESRDDMGLARSEEGGAREDRLRSRDISQALATSEASQVTTLGFGTFAATLKSSPDELSLAPGRAWAAAALLTAGSRRQGAAREQDRAVQTDGGNACVAELSGSRAHTLAGAVGQPHLRSLGRRTSDELTGCGGKALSGVPGSPESRLPEQTPPYAVSAAATLQPPSTRIQRPLGELEEEREDVQGSLVGESPEPEQGAGGTMDTTGVGDATASSSPPTSGVLSVCSRPRASSVPSQGAPTEPPCSEPQLHRLALWAEPPKRDEGERDQEILQPAWSPGLAAFDCAQQRGQEVAGVAAVKGAAKACVLLPPLFTRALWEGRGASQAPRAEFMAGQLGVPPLAGSQCLTRRGLGLVGITSWHHSGLLRKPEGAPLRAASDLGQKTSHQPEGPAPSSRKSCAAGRPMHPGEDNPVGVQAAASLLPNQVSVITKQTRPEPTPSARSEPPQLPRGQPTLAPESPEQAPGHMPSLVRHGGQTEASAQRVTEGAVTKRTSPEVSTSCRKLDFGSPSNSSCGSSPENSYGSPSSKLSCSPENIPVQKQEMALEAAVRAEAQKQDLFLCATSSESSRTGAERLLSATEATVPGGFPVEEKTQADPGRPGGVAVAISATSGLQQSPTEAPQLPLQAPVSPEGPGTAEPAWSSAVGRKDEATQAVPQSSLPGSLFSYTDIREPAEGDTEVEESEAPSCSEGENEAEALRAEGRPGTAPAATAESAARDAGTAEPGSGFELGSLTSALQDWDISALSEVDGLSTSEVVRFLESCQLRDYSSADSVSECSSKGTLGKERSRELKLSEAVGEKHRKHLWEEEAIEASEEGAESEEDDSLFRKPGQLAQCSLETLAKVLTQIGQGLQATHRGHSALLTSVAADLMDEQGHPQETSSASSCPSEPAPQAAHSDTEGGAPASNRADSQNTQSRPGGDLDAPRPTDGREGAPSDAAGSSPVVEQVAQHSASGEAGATFQCQVSTVTSEVIKVLLNKDQNLVIEKGNNWTIINGVALVPSVDQVILCDAPGDAPAAPDQEGLGTGFTAHTKTPEPGPVGPQEARCNGGSAPVHGEISSSGQSSNFDKSRLRNRPVRPSVRISSQIFDQDFESPPAASDHTYCNSKLEPCAKSKRSKVSNKDQSGKAAKTSATGRVETDQREVSESPSGEREQTKTQRSHKQTVLATADTSTPTEGPADTLSKIRQEVGPPLPPLLAPLIATPPRTLRSVSPLISSSSPTSPVGPLSPLCDLPAPPRMSEAPGHPSPPCPSPSPSSVSAGGRILSSPLQFCAATPKHAVPVPGRLPPLAAAHTAAAGPPENSVKILDTMYPELSARARTLNLLKGNIQLTRGAPADGQSAPGPVGAITGFKAITPTSTAFVKAGGSSGGDSGQDRARDLGAAQQDSGGKRVLPSSAPRSAKRLRLDSSPEPDPGAPGAEGLHKHARRKLPPAEAPATEEESSSAQAGSTAPPRPLSPRETVESHDRAIADALRRIAEAPFDLLPVIRSHVYVGNISRKPVMRDQEKDVVHEFSTTRKHLAECLLHSILAELRAQKASVEHSYVHALCRVYVGICRQLGDLERARLLCYSLLKEDFPESEKLTLFIANMWHEVFLSQSVVSTAMQLVARQRAKGEVLNCLRAFLSWEKNAPVDVGFMVSKLLLTIQLCPKTEFQSSERFGEDLSDATWEYIFAIDLLCCHQKWVWTHDNIVSKELWPVMDKWIKYRKGHANIAYTPDVIIASVLRLIGRLGQLGLKEGFPSAVKNISSVIGMFIQHAQDEDIPWGVQLAAVYALCDLSPSNPAEVSAILEAWCKAAAHSVPPAVLGGLEEVRSLCAEDLG